MSATTGFKSPPTWCMTRRKNTVASSSTFFPMSKTQRSSNLWVAPSDPHPNALAHDLIARGLFEALERHQKVGSDPR